LFFIFNCCSNSSIQKNGQIPQIINILKTNNVKIGMKLRCRHDIKIGILLKLFEPLTKKNITRKTRLKSPKLNKILEDLKERRLIQELKSKDGRILYHTTPKGKKLVKVFKHIMEHLEGKKVLPHISSSYR